MTSAAHRTEPPPEPYGAPPPYAAAPTAWRADDIFSMQALVGLIVRRWAPMLATAAVVIALIAAISLLSPRTFTARSLVMVSTGQERVLNEGEMIADGGGASSNAAIESEIQVLKTPALSARVAEQLKIADDPAWRQALTRSSPLSAVRGFVQSLFTPGEQTRDAIRARVAGAVASSYDIRRRGASYVIEIAAQADTPERAAALANGLAEQYLQAQVEARMQVESQASSWLGGRVEQLREEVRQKEAEAEAFRAANGLLDADGSDLTERQTAEQQAAVMSARADLVAAQARQAQMEALLSSGSSLDTMADVMNSATIRELRSRQADIARREADVQERYGELHPAVQAVQIEREENERLIATEIARISANVGNEVQVARARLGAMMGGLSSVRSELVANNSAYVRLRELEREAAAARSVYETYLQRAQQIADQGSLRFSQSRLVSHASAGTRDAPKIPLLLAVAIGLAAGFLVGLLIEAFDDTLNNADDVSRKLDAPLLASIPFLPEAKTKDMTPGAQHPAGYLVEKPMSAFAEAFRVLRTSALYARNDQRVKVLAMTSAMPNEGKTTLSLCLARVTALMGQRAILIDCDLRRRSVNEVLGLEPAVGLLEVLSKQVRWESAVLTDDRSGMDLLPLTNTEFSPRDVFGSEAMQQLLQELRTRYDFIVLDCAPLLAVAETRVLVSHADAAVVVARWEKTPVRAVRAALAQIAGAGVSHYGIALNCVEARGATYRDALYFDREAGGYYSQ